MRKPSLLLFAVAAGLFATAPLHAEDAPQPGFFQRTWEAAQFWKGWDLHFQMPQLPFAGKKEKPTRSLGLEMTLTLSPQTVQLSETRQIIATIRLTNKTKRAVQLQFPTSQRFDVWLHNGAGKTIEQWSEDQSFDKEPVFITINPREFIEYTAKVATREMKAGGLYVIQASILGYEGLAVEQSVMPQK
jgi:hypothetical protein